MTKQSHAEFLNEYLKDPGDPFWVMPIMLEASKYLRAPLRFGVGSPHPNGKRYSVASDDGQEVSIVIDATGKVIERTYKDRGDVHRDDVIKAVRGWMKAVDQAHSGGRPKGRSEQTAREYKALYSQFVKSGLSERDFCEKYGVKRAKLQRAKRSAAKRFD